MPILHYETRISPDGHIVLPPIPEYRDRKVIVRVHEENDEISETVLERGDDTVDQQQRERQQRIAAERARIMDRTPEERDAAFEDFMTSWKGCLKGVPHMTAKEIRAERLEKKYGQRAKKENEE
jgi:hypothetical protein